MKFKIMRSIYLIPFICLTALSITAQADSLHKCQAVEYAELKDMDTFQLVLRISRYHTNYKLLATLKDMPRTSSEKQEYENTLATCRSEAQRIAAIANKRKNLSKSGDYGICDKECEEFSFLRYPKSK